MTTNQKLSEIFNEFSEILELKGDSRFKIVAYRRVSQSIASLPEDVEDIYRRGGTSALDEIEGVGEGISSKIEEFIKSGHIRELDKLKKEFPVLETAMMRVPGIGAKTAQRIYSHFKPRSLDDMKSKLEKRGREIFGEKVLKNILEGIAFYSKAGRRMMIDQAEKKTLPLIKYLERKGNCVDLCAGGSLRRMQETVGDIDLVASSDSPPGVTQDFAFFPDFVKIINRGDTKASAVLSDGTRVDVEVLDTRSFGSLLLHFTGSKQHNIDLRKFALERGLSISEYGVKDISTGKLKKFSDEKSFYKYLGLEFIPPELREGRGEVAAAVLKNGKSKLPNLVTQADIRGDLHIHSNFSDGTSTIDEIAQKAIDLGYEYIAIADHTKDLKIAGGLSADGFVKRDKEISSARKKYPDLTIFSSCEVNILSDGSLDLDDDTLSKFDLVTASIHSNFNQTKEEITSRLVKAISNRYVKNIGHPTGRIFGKRDGYILDWIKIFDACVKHNVALEINSSPFRLDINDSVAAEAKRAKVRLAISTDAHSVSQMENMRFGVAVARRGWAEANDVINTSGATEVLSRLAKKR